MKQKEIAREKLLLALAEGEYLKRSAVDELDREKYGRKS